jgi:hypothetical protein
MRHSELHLSQQCVDRHGQSTLPHMYSPELSLFVLEVGVNLPGQFALPGVDPLIFP